MIEYVVNPLFFFVLFVCAGVGYALPARFCHRLVPDFFLTFSLGWGIFSLIIFFAGLFNLYHPVFFFLLVIMGLVSFGWWLAGEGKRVFLSFSLPRAGKGVFFLLLLFVGWVSLSAFTPAFMDDVLNYHLPVPHYYLKAGGIETLFYNLHSNMPFLGQMPWIIMLHYSHEYAIKLILVFQFVSLLVIQYALGKRVLPAFWSLLACLVFALVYGMVWFQAPVFINNDVTMGLFTFCAVYSLVVFFEKGGKKWLIWTALFLGFALSTKYFAIIFALPFICIIFLYQWWGRKREFFRPMILVFSLAFLVLSPWLVKQFVVTGNPVYPVLYDVFPTEDLYTHAARRRTVYTESGTTGTALDVVSPEKEPDHPGLLDHALDKMRFPINYTDYLFFLGIIFVLAGLFSKNRTIRFYSWLGAATYGGFVLLGGIQWHRYFSIHYPLVTIVVMYFIYRLFEQPVLSAPIRKSAMLLFIVLNIVNFASSQYSHLQDRNFPPLMAVSETQRATFYERVRLGDFYHATAMVNETVPSDSKFILFSGNHGYPFEPLHVVACRDGLRSLYEYYLIDKTPSQSRELFKEDGIEYLVLYPFSPRIVQRESPLSKFVEKYGEVTYTDEKVGIYKIR